MKRVVAFFGGVGVHRLTALVIVLFVGIQGFLSVHGTDVGLDANSASYALGIAGGVVIVARELVVPVLLPFFDGLFGANK